LADYYRKRAIGGFSLIISESCAVDHPSATQGEGFGRLAGPGIPAWRRCVEGVKSAGAHMLIQLWHEGAVRKEGGNGPWSDAPTLSPSGLLKRDRPNGRAATLEELDEIKDAFVRGALTARAIGADGVEIHACHGYLIDQFLWAETNLRDDGYGGTSIEARARFPMEIVAAIRAATGPGFIISFRLSQWKECDYEARIVETPAEFTTLLRLLKSAGVSAFHISTRRFDRPEWPESKLGLAGWAKRLSNIPIITVGSVGLDRDVMESLAGQQSTDQVESGLRELVRRFQNGEFDLVAVGRSSIADPQWVSKVAQGQYDEIRTFRVEHLELEDFQEQAVENFRAPVKPKPEP
jgi:2,4-dienoyl-CoA reductase-like NADH-dependent reductase (Old Yellow Enzyme family)